MRRNLINVYFQKVRQLLLLVMLIGFPFFSMAEGGIKAIGIFADFFTLLITFLILVSIIISAIWGQKYSTIRVIVYLLCGISLLLWFVSVLFSGPDNSMWLNYSVLLP